MTLQRLHAKWNFILTNWWISYTVVSLANDMVESCFVVFFLFVFLIVMTIQGGQIIIH